MPPVVIYSVNFAHGNVHPYWNPRGWPDMRFGETNATDYPERTGDSEGLNLRVGRLPSATSSASNSVYVITDRTKRSPFGLPLGSRLTLKVEFDLPLGESWVDSPSNQVPEAWAIGLGVKSFGDENDLATDRMTTTTCQFNRDSDGIRLNVPGNLQKSDKSAVMDSPLDYSKYQALGPNLEWLRQPPLFTMEHSFCGVDAAANGHVVGCGSLTIKNMEWFAFLTTDKFDQRAYSSADLSSSGDKFITALGVSLVTKTGIGRISVRLRRFTVSINRGVASQP